MTADRELLALAAKAAGVPKRDLDDRYDTWEETPILIHRAWNPLTNDGDALRLAVKLGIVIDTSDGVHVQWIVGGVARPITIYEFDDIYAATRRAIVLAAAEIGRAMP